MSSSIYTQLPLAQPDKQIRLLRLEPPSSDHDDHIFSLAVYNFDENSPPPYVAISYTWGAPVPLLSIIVNGIKVQVQFNCWYALWQMRHHGYTGKSFWIDSLCINQSDGDEKSVQVAMMGEIYTSADWVASCLGIGDSTGSLSEVLRSGDSGALKTAGEKIDQLPYFERVWVKQEIILARDVTLFSGVEKISWAELSTMSEMAKEMQKRQKTQILSRSSQFYPCFCRSCRPLLYENEESSSQKTGFSCSAIQLTFMDVAYEHQTAKATDPKDKIYALLPLLPKDDIIRQNLPIVYGKGRSLSLLKNLSRLLHRGYKALDGRSKNLILGLAAQWLQSDLAEDALSCMDLAAWLGPGLGEGHEEYVELPLRSLRVIHEDEPHIDSGQVLRVEATTPTSMDIDKDYLAYNDNPVTGCKGKQYYKQRSVTSIPSNLKDIKVIYNYHVPRSTDPDQGHKPGARAIMFFVNANVRPGDVIVVLEWGRISWKDRKSEMFAHAILRPIHVADIQPGTERSTHEPVYVFHSWAVPASDCPRLLYDDDHYQIPEFSFKSRIKQDPITSWPDGRLKLHLKDALTLLLTIGHPLQSLMHSLTANSLGRSCGMSFVEDENWRPDTERLSAYVERQTESAGKDEPGEWTIEEFHGPE